MICYWVFDRTMLDSALHDYLAQCLPGNVVGQAEIEAHVVAFLTSVAARRHKLLIDAEIALEHRMRKP